MNAVLAALLAQVWALDATVMHRLAGVIERHASGVRLDAVQIEAAVGASPQAAQARRDAAAGGSGGVAVLPLYGVVAHRAHMVRNVSGPGGTSSELFGAAFREALADERVGAILLDVDSPGGAVAGTPELVDLIYQSRGQGKPIVASANALAASAAYWIGSAADEFVVTPSGSVGSIGVLAAHEDRSEAAAKEGRRITYVTAGKYKAEGNPHEPLTDEARAEVQRMVDHAYGVLVESIARNRGVSVQAVREGYGEGRMFHAKQALAAGMVDRIETFDATLARLANPRRRSRISAARNAVRLAEA